MATTNAFCLASPPLARICLHGDLQRFGRRLSLYVNTAAEAIRALSLQVPGFRRQMNEGWYQIRIAGDDTAPEAVYARLHEQLGEGTVIHIVPRLAGAGKADCRLCWGGSHRGLFLHGRCLDGVMGYSPECRRFFCHHDVVFTGGQHDTGRCGPDAGPEGKTPDYRATDNGRQNTYFSSLDNMIARGTRCRCLTGNAGWLPPYIPGHQHP